MESLLSTRKRSPFRAVMVVENPWNMKTRKFRSGLGPLLLVKQVGSSDKGSMLSWHNEEVKVDWRKWCRNMSQQGQNINLKTGEKKTFKKKRPYWGLKQLNCNNTGVKEVQWSVLQELVKSPGNVVMRLMCWYRQVPCLSFCLFCLSWFLHYSSSKKAFFGNELDIACRGGSSGRICHWRKKLRPSWYSKEVILVMLPWWVIRSVARYLYW